jgi:hypothetical protein
MYFRNVCKLLPEDNNLVCSLLEKQINVLVARNYRTPKDMLCKTTFALKVVTGCRIQKVLSMGQYAFLMGIERQSFR